MQVQRKNLPASRVKLTLTVEAAQFEEAFQAELAEVAKQTNLPGFRPGKAPLPQVLLKVGRPRVEAGALDRAVSAAYFEALSQEKLAPVANPEIEVSSFELPKEGAPESEQVAKFTAEVDVFPEIKMDGYRKIRIKNAAQVEVPEDEVERVLKYLQKQHAALPPAEAEAKAEEGMWAEIGYEGSVGGVKRADMANQNHPLILGEGQLIPGFEEGILGMKVGESKSLHLTFPKDYAAKELAGKKADFNVTLKQLKRVELPNRDAAFAAQYGHKTVAELTEAIRQSLTEEKEHQEQHRQEEEVMEELLKLAKFEVPTSLVEQELERMVKETEERLQKMNFNWERYLEQVKKSREEVRAEMRGQAEKNVRLGLALGKVMQEEGISEKDGGGGKAVERLLEIAAGKSK